MKIKTKQEGGKLAQLHLPLSPTSLSQASQPADFFAALDWSVGFSLRDETLEVICLEGRKVLSK